MTPENLSICWMTVALDARGEWGMFLRLVPVLRLFGEARAGGPTWEKPAHKITWPTHPGYRPVSSSHEALVFRIKYGHGKVPMELERWDEAGSYERRTRVDSGLLTPVDET